MSGRLEFIFLGSELASIVEEGFLFVCIQIMRDQSLGKGQSKYFKEK
jgi:hypothetical protein